MYQFNREETASALDLALDLMDGLGRTHGIYEPELSWREKKGVRLNVFFALTPKDEAENLILRLNYGSDDPHEDAPVVEVEPAQAKTLAFAVELVRGLVAAHPDVIAEEVAASMMDGRGCVAFILPDGTAASWTISLDT